MAKVKYTKNLLKSLICSDHSEAHQAIIEYISNKIELSTSDYFYYFNDRIRIDIINQDHLTEFILNVLSPQYYYIDHDSVSYKVDLSEEGSLDRLCEGLFQSMQKIDPKVFNVKWIN